MDFSKVDAKVAEIEQEEKQAAEPDKGIFDTINDTLAGVINPNAIRSAMGETYGPGSEDMNPTTYRPLGKIEDVISEIPGDFVNAATEVGKTRQNFWHNVSNMQQAYLDAQETGDFSGFNKAVDDTRNAGREASVALANVMASPVRSAARNFIKLNADNPASPYQSLAQSLQMTDVGIEYFTTDEEHLQKSREIEEALGLPPESTLADNAAFKEALEMYYFKQKYDNIEYVWEEYPELKNIASMDKEAAAIALHNIHTVKESHSTIDTFITFLGKGNRELELNNIQFKIAEGKATDEEIKRAEELKKEIAQDKTKAPGFFQDPLGAMAAGVAESLPEMGQSVAGGVAGGGAAATAITLAAVAATVLTGGTDLLVAGGIAGARTMIMRVLASQGGKQMLKAWATTGAVAGMYAPEEGQRYGEYKEMKKKDGTPLYTDEQARYYASAGALANSVLEIAPTFAVAGKALPVATRVFQQSAESIVRQSLGRETLKDIGVAAAGNWLKITATESGEEALQSVADDVIRNIALESKGKDADHYQQYSAGDILTRAGAAFVESLPASMAFGFAGVGGSAVVGAGRAARSRKRAAEMENLYGKQQAQTMMGAMMVEQLQKNVQDGNLNKVAPDVQRQVIREQLKGTGFENAWIDIEMAMQKETGREDLKKIAEAQGMSADELEAAITSNGYMSVPTETLSQLATSPDILDSVSFTPEADSMARMRVNGKKIVEEYEKNMQKAVERQLKLADTIIDNYIPAESDEQRKKQREVLKAVMLQNLQNPAQGWNELYKIYNDELQEKIGPALEALKKGMGNAGLLEVQDEQGNTKTQRYTENAEWYRNFYKIHKRKPTQAELQDMAIAMTIGDPNAPKVAGWVPDSAETQATMEQERPVIETLKQNIDLLNSVKAEAKKMTGVEMELTEGLSPEAFKVYRAISSWTEKAGGKIARAGRMTALLWARHADIVADIITKKTGQKYTAEDYLRKHLLLELVKDGQFGEGLNQTQGELAEEKLKRDMETWKKDLKEAWKRSSDNQQMVQVMETPLVLQMVGARHLPMRIKRSKIETIKKEHPEMKKEVLNKLPEHMADPMAIFKSTTVPGRLVVCLELKGTNKVNVVVPVELDYKENVTEINLLASAYSRKNKQGEIQQEWFDDNFFKNNTVLYMNKEKVVNFYASARLQLPLDRRNFDDSFLKIINFYRTADEKPLMSEEEFSNLMESIKDETDLVKMKNENPGLYQLAGVRATNAPLEALERAKEMESAAAYADDIFKETGWVKGQDGKWRFEIPDNLDAVNWDVFKKGNTDNKNRLLKSVYKNPKLYEAYPWLANIVVEVRPMEGNTYGGVAKNGHGEYIVIKEDIGDEQKSGTLIHEIQHLIQDEEGFAVGGTEETAYKQIIDRIKDLNKKIQSYNYGTEYADAVMDQQEMLLTGTENPEAEEILKAEINELEKKISAKEREEIWQLASDRQYLREALNENMGDENSLYRNLAGEQEARHATDRAIIHTNVDRAEKTLAEMKAKYEAEKAKQSPEMKKMLDELEALREKDKKTDAEFERIDEIQAAMDDNLMQAETFYSWAKDTLDMRKQEAAEKPQPHGINGSAIIVFNGEEFAAKSSDINAIKALPLDQLFQRAWHGSPFDFESFDLGAIGTGEGAQAHGWGLYFAANREISEAYKNKLSGKSVRINGELYMTVPSIQPNQVRIGQEVVENGGIYWAISALEKNNSVDEAIAELKKKSQSRLKGLARNAKAALEFLQDKEIKLNNGKLFEVEIPDNDVLLDEQKPLSQQPEKVKEAIIAYYKTRPDYYGEVDDNSQLPQTAGKYFYRDVIYQLQREGVSQSEAPKEASLLLNELGIKGITYEGGRDGRCFVVFDDKAIDIIEKYNQQVNGQQRRTLGNIDIKPNKDGQRTIHILETANESTFMHEMAHMFLFDLEELGRIDEDSAKQLEIVNKWATWEKGAAQEYKGTDWYKDFADLEQAIIDAEEHGDYETAEKRKAEWRQERFARGFELYLKEGNAPAKGLQAVFRMFKQFLRAIYIRFISDGGKPTEAVKRVMDRMIASEEEIEAAALEDRYRDTLKAGGEKLFNEKEEETMKRWLSEEKETAKEKVLKVIMKDLEKEKQAEFRARMDAERERYEKELSQENIFLARKAVDYTKSKDIVTRWFGSVEEFEALDAAVPSMESLVEAHMKEFGDKLDQELIESHLSKEAVDAAMQSGKYRAKMESYILKGMERKKALINKINAKARAAMDSIEDKLNALPEDIDFKLEATSPAIKGIMQEITRLRFAGKWDTADINHIEAMMRASTQQEVRKALKEFKAKQAEAKQDLRDIEEATKGLENFYRDLVKKTTEEKPMTETCNVKYYLDKERNAERRVKAMAKIKNWDMAIQQQQQKVFYSMMVKQARKNKEERDKMVKVLEKKLNAKTVRLPKDERYWFHQLLYLIRINKNKPKVPEGGVARLEDLFKEQQETLDLLILPEELINIRDNGENYGDYNQMSLAKFRQAYNDLIRLYTIGRDKFNFKSIDGKSIEEAAWEIQNDTTRNDGILTLTRKIGPDQGGLSYLDAVGNLGEAGHKVAKGLQRYHTSILKPENILKQLGEKAYKYTYGLLEKAAEHEAKLLEKNLRTIQEINSMFTREERAARTERLYDFPGTKGWKISKENILIMAINWGTEQNRQRLIGGLIEDGRMKSDKSAQEVQQNIEKLFVETMTEKDWQFIQKLWDYIGSYWHDTAAVEEKLNGVAMGRVENKPFTITTADGKEATLKGGYMHLRYDPDKSSRAEEQEINDAVLSMTAGARSLGMGRGMTKARTKQNIYRELDLHFSVIEQHLYDVIHNIAYRTVLRDVYRLLHYKNYKTGVNLEEYFRRTLGVEAYRVVDTWALDAWRQVNDTRNSADGALNRFFRWVRSNSTMCVMGMRLKPVLDNIGNIPIAMGRIGSFKMLAGMFDFYSNRADNMEEVKQLSAFMRTRAENLDRDLRSQPGTFRAGNRVLEFAREHAYDALVMTDLAVSAPLWKRAYKDCYESKIEEVKKENEENIAKRLELAAKVDQLKAEIAEHFAAAKDIDQYLQARRFGRTNGIASAQETVEGNPYAGLSDEVLRAESGNHKQQRQELGKELYKAEQQLEQAQQLPVYDDAEILDEASQRAVFEADSVVRETFGSGRVIDQPAVMRSTNEFVRLFTAFYSFFNAQYNMIYMSYMKSKYPPAGTGGIERWAPLARTVIYNVIFSALLTSAVAYAFGLKGDDKDDKEKTVMGPDGKKEKVEIPGTQRFLKLWAQESLSIGTGGLYGIRDFVQLLSDYAFDGKNYGYKMGSIATRGFTELGKAFTQLMQKGEKDAEIAAKEEKRQREHEEKLQKLKGKKRQEYLQKWEEEQKYKKPPKRITYSEILGHTAKGVASFTAARTGITGTMTNAVTGTMQYMFDTDMRYDPTWKNIIWSALFDKKPVEREIPKKPPAEPKTKKGKKGKQSGR